MWLRHERPGLVTAHYGASLGLSMYLGAGFVLGLSLYASS